jgi:Bifunctional DNA primase/polymerase, N-terminal/AAA domain/Primase C terminal 1 (PriCT-1)
MPTFPSSGEAEERAAPFVRAARRYSELDWTLLHLDGKRPKAKAWEKTTYDAPELAAGKWSEWGKRWNMGVLLGASGLEVVEPDTPQALETLLELCGGELPRTPTVQSGGKSVHLYFRANGPVNAARDGLELRGDRQQCVLPPSVHPETGRAYVWRDGLAPWEVELGDVPWAVIEYIGAKSTKQKAPPVPDMIPVGSRHRELLSIAGTMRRRGLGFDEIAAALKATNERCEVPLPAEEVVELAADVVRRYEPAPPDPARQRLEAEADRLFAAAVEVMPVKRERRQTAPLIVSLVEFLGGDEDDAAWLVDHLAARGALVLVAGLPKVGKSTFVYGLLGALTSPADRFVGLPAGSTWALLMTEEPPATVEEKVDRFGVDDEHVYVISKRRMGASRSWPKIVEAAVAFCRAHPEVGVCVIDTWDKFVGLTAKRSETDTGVIVESVEPLYELLGLGVCVILITHQRKEHGEFGLRVRGGTALTGSADVIVEVERASESAGLSKQSRVLKIVSRFAGAPDEIAVELAEDEWRSLGTVKGAQRRARREETLGLLSGEPATREQLVQAAAGKLSDRTLRRRLDELVRQGLVERVGEGTKGDPYRWRLTEAGQIWVATANQGCHESAENGSTMRDYSWHAAGGPVPPGVATNSPEDPA